MIEPTSESGKNDAAATAAPAAGGEEDGEEEEVDGGTAKETGASLRSEEVGSLQESILSHTATMVVGHNTQLEKRDKQVTIRLCTTVRPRRQTKAGRLR